MMGPSPAVASVKPKTAVLKRFFLPSRPHLLRPHPSTEFAPCVDAPLPSPGFNVEKGYGFIALDDEVDKDVFVHQSDIYAPGFRSLAEGEALEFRLMTDDKTGKMKAVDVTGPDGAYVQGAPRQGEDDGG